MSINCIMKKISVLSVLLGAVSFSSAQTDQSLLGIYTVSEVCTLAEDNSYIENADYTITLENCQDPGYNIMFSVPVHSIPDFVKANTVNESNFVFSQIFNLDEDTETPRFLRMEGYGQVKKDSLVMKYMLEATGTYGSLQCVVKGIRKNVGTENKKAHSSTVFLNGNQQIVFMEQWRGKSFDFALFDAGGRCVLTRKISGQTMDVSFLPAGVYVYRIAKNAHLIEAGKVFKNR